ncbi:hypothetical protein NEMBOFW57_006975 [Staphylotrichum longicolle]|uniref:BHLH domain-containing protein n=1 Tax=Staphylotrichum longicolle TaxID=669026 RepID=A0AAD4HUW0_9PEZI|nr:hypothetical protein NEMBOFW57_006975 [Staphylotrichum longicolle]
MSDVNAAVSTDSQQFQTLASLPAVGSSAHLKRSSWSEDSSTTLSPAPSIEDSPTDKPKRSKSKAHARKHSIQLRTAARKPRKAASIPLAAVASAATAANKKPASVSEEEEDDLTPEERRARRNHNIVEKQYRNRLNAQFERLLAVLPVEQCRAARAGGAAASAGAGDRIMSVGNGSVGDEKRLSKAEVLDLATRRIRALEAEREKLWKERKELLRSLEVLMAGAVGMRQGVAGQLPVVGLGGPVGRV